MLHISRPIEPKMQGFHQGSRCFSRRHIENLIELSFGFDVALIGRLFRWRWRVLNNIKSSEAKRLSFRGIEFEKWRENNAWNFFKILVNILGTKSRQSLIQRRVKNGDFEVSINRNRVGYQAGDDHKEDPKQTHRGKADHMNYGCGHSVVMDKVRRNRGNDFTSFSKAERIYSLVINYIAFVSPKFFWEPMPRRVCNSCSPIFKSGVAQTSERRNVGSLKKHGSRHKSNKHV